MGLVEEFEEAVLDRIDRFEKASDVPLSRNIEVNEPILEYPQDDKEELCDFFVRHSEVTANEKLMVFALHGKELFSWVQISTAKGKEITPVCRVYDMKLHGGLSQDFYILEKYDPKDPAEIAIYGD